MTAYYCGLGVAENLNRDRAATTDATVFAGVESLKAFILHCYNTTERPPVLIRIGIGSEEHADPPQSHVWNVVANPDGSFHWLQSFVGFYSLHAWMKKCEELGQRNLSLADLLLKLDKVRALQSIEYWNKDANDLYQELFNVDISKANGPRLHKWVKEKHRLDHFYWDPACSYPLSPTSEKPKAGEL